MNSHTCAAWRYSDGPGRSCPGCRAAFNAYTRDLKDRRRAALVMVKGRPTATRSDLPHGSPSTYNNHGCKCTPCTRAHAEARADRRRRASRRDPS